MLNQIENLKRILQLVQKIVQRIFAISAKNKAFLT